MDRNADSEGSESRFASYVEHMASSPGARGSACAVPLRPYGAHSSRRSEERGADGGPHRTPPRSRRASVAASFCRQRRLGAGGSAATRSDLCSSRHREERQDKRLDCRRHGIPQEGRSFCRRRPAILRSAWQAGQLSDRGLAVGSQRTRKPADRLSALPSQGIGQPIRFAGQEPACPRTSCSRPNRKSPLTRSRPRATRACRKASYWRMRVTGSTRRSGPR